jgi:fatty acid desaturase
MNSLEIFKNAFATIVSILAIYRFFYVARYAKKDGKMRVLRTLLITAAFLLTVGGVATVVLINFWGVALLFVGGVCLFIDIEYFKTNNNTRFVARYVKKKGMVDKYGLMKFDP